MAIDVTNEFNILFQEHIERSSGHVLRRIISASIPVEDDLRLAQHILTYALELPSAWIIVRDLLLAMAPQMERAGYREEWIVFLNKGLTVSEKTQDTEAEAYLYLYKGSIYQLLAKHDAAHASFEDARQKFQVIGDNLGLSKALNRLAFITCVWQDRYEEAMSLSQHGLSLLKRNDPECAAHYNLMGRVRYLLRDWSGAEKYYRRALEIRERQNDKRLIGYNLRDLSNVLGKLGRLDEAIKCCQRGIALLGEVHDVTEQASCRIALGTLYLETDPAKSACVL